MNHGWWASAILAMGCKGAESLPITSDHEFGASTLPQRRQTLVLEGTSFPVVVSYLDNKRSLIVKMSEGESNLDREEYEESPAAFSLAEAEDTEYFPSLPLITFPMKVGDTWTWHGKTASFGKSLPAVAQVSSRTETLRLGKSVHNTVRIDVRLTLGERSDANPPLRRLTFWFAPGGGLLQRDFSGTSIRKLAAP